MQIHSIELDWLASKASNLIFPSIEEETNRLRLSVWDDWMTIRAWDRERWLVHLSVQLIDNKRERERERERHITSLKMINHFIDSDFVASSTLIHCDINMWNEARN